MKEINSSQFNAVSGAGFGDTCGSSGNNCGGSSGSNGGNAGNYQDRSYQTSNRGSGSQANNFGKGGSFGSSGGCAGGSRNNGTQR